MDKGTSIFNTPVAELQRWSKGEPIAASKLNKSVTAINKLREGVRFPVRLFLRLVAEAVPPVQQFKIKSVQGDYITCRTWDSEEQTEGEEDVLVAKPYLLRRTPFDGETYDDVLYVYVTDTERTATTGDPPDLVVITEFVRPPYNIDDFLYATEDVGGGVEVDVADKPLEWLDDNRDARRWSPSAASGFVFPVRLIRVGGVQGTSTSVCSFAYQIRDVLTSEVIASSVNPVVLPHRWRRPSVGFMIEATYGFASYGSTTDPDELVIGWINEVPEQASCTT